jgi:hypothetical protein
VIDFERYDRDGRWIFADDDVCGLPYRPGEVDPGLNHCRLVRGHQPADVHSTRQTASDMGGFEWKVGKRERILRWPDGSTKEAPIFQVRTYE